MSSNEALTLSEEQLDRLADLLATKLAQVKPVPPVMLTVEDVCTTFQVSRAWVYENAHRLGGVKLGPGRRAPLRFEAKKVLSALDPLGWPNPQTTANGQTKHLRARTTHLHPVYDG